ncbi:TetR/AcrR family transcriptional regulator [Vulgatibacter incomptus]|uniref:Transcriptional regulator, TetR family n=1 Tax=Vulgatibacter incomptus TaxID=1391653 RepID=A0A0K1PGY8_9BACT|nr:TetR/AcrR family transcriptional regulator [Vulgatibacter incomptus]AKU92384.1 Transcriptional regulator, TetR family [Vulgatibacter incomptus]
MSTDSERSKGGRYHHGDLRRALLDAALEQVQQEGAATLSLREVARRAGVTHAAPYRHFASKEALLAAVAEEGFRTLREGLLEASVRLAGDPLGKLQAIGVAYVLFAVAHPAHFRVMFTVGQNDCDYPSLDEASGSAFGVLVESIEEGRQAGALCDVPASELAVTAWSTVHGLASLLVEEKLPPAAGSAEQLARMVTARLLEGLAAPAETTADAKKTKPAKRAAKGANR